MVEYGRALPLTPGVYALHCWSAELPVGLQGRRAPGRQGAGAGAGNGSGREVVLHHCHVRKQGRQVGEWGGEGPQRNHFGQRDVIFILFHLTRLHEYNSDTQK